MKRPTPKADLGRLVLMAVFAALTVALQYVMSPLPNIEPVSLIVIAVSWYYGAYVFFSVGIFVAAEFLIYGFGLWSVNYIYIWAILAAAVLILKKLNKAALLPMLSGVFGLLFGTLCSIPYFFIGGISGGIAYIAAGLGFDLVHGIANFVLALLLLKPIGAVFEKFTRK